MKIEIEPGFSILLGNMKERLYSSTGYKISELNWEIEPLYNFDLTIGAIYKRTGLHANFNYSLPLRCGTMQDSDWNRHNIKTKYTESEQSSKLNLGTSVTFDWKFEPSPKIQLYPVIQAEYTYDSFQAENGIGYYGSSEYSKNGKDVVYTDPNARKVRIYGIDYQRHSFYTFFGLDFKILPVKNFSSHFQFLISPFTYTSAFDFHHGKYNPFTMQEIQYSYFSRFKFCVGAETKISRHFSLGIDSSYLHGKESKGELYSDYWSEKLLLVDEQKSSADINVIKILTYLKFKS